MALNDLDSAGAREGGGLKTLHIRMLAQHTEYNTNIITAIVIYEHLRASNKIQWLTYIWLIVRLWQLVNQIEKLWFSSQAVGERAWFSEMTVFHSGPYRNKWISNPIKRVNLKKYWLFIKLKSLGNPSTMHTSHTSWLKPCNASASAISPT